VKFWKKMVELVEFVKQFRAHLGRINALVCSGDGLRVCTTGSDKAVKFFDVSSSFLYFLSPSLALSLFRLRLHSHGSSFFYILHASLSSSFFPNYRS